MGTRGECNERRWCHVCRDASSSIELDGRHTVEADTLAAERATSQAIENAHGQLAHAQFSISSSTQHRCSHHQRAGQRKARHGQPPAAPSRPRSVLVTDAAAAPRSTGRADEWAISRSLGLDSALACTTARPVVCPWHRPASRLFITFPTIKWRPAMMDGPTCIENSAPSSEHRITSIYSHRALIHIFSHPARSPNFDFVHHCILIIVNSIHFFCQHPHYCAYLTLSRVQQIWPVKGSEEAKNVTTFHDLGSSSGGT